MKAFVASYFSANAKYSNSGKEPVSAEITDRGFVPL